jgi:uncharacterized protein (TIRG00374 family)
VIVSIVCSAFGYLVFALWGGWHEVTGAAAKVGLMGIAICLLMSSINYCARFLRWQGYLQVLGHPIPWRKSLQIYLAGFALTTTPGKAGEALRGVLLKPHGVPYSKSFAAFFSERLSDLFAIVVLTFFGLSVYPEAQSMIVIGIILVTAGIALFTQHRLLQQLEALIPQRHGKALGLARHLLRVFLEAHRCHRPGILLSATLLSLIGWGAEALAFYWILVWIGAELPLAFSTFVFALALLAGALSFMPGGLGGNEAVMVTLLIWKGVPVSDAIAATVLIRLATLWFAVGIGMVFLASLHISQDK